MKPTDSNEHIAAVGSKMSRPVKAAVSESVKVVVRCRPMNEKEVAEGYDRVLEMWPDRGVIELKNTRHGSEHPKQFTFDAVYDWNSKQLDLYDETFRPLVDSVLTGFNGTIFAYGQTGTGKTYTMEGIRSDPERKGVIPHSFDHIFNHIARSKNQQYLLRTSYLEIYQEEIRDLLCKDQTKRLELKERPDTGVYVRDLSTFVCKSANEIEHVMSVGNQNRSVGATNMNEHSSRSHAIFIITIECSEIGIDGENHIRVGKLNLVDLAGSERQAKTGASGERLKEATKINLSLSALGNVISALVDGKNTHIPYRDSKLTRLLQDSLGGNAKTVMVANIGPASYNYDETLTTLRYANRAKNIKNKPRINEDPKDALLREFQQEIARLKASLAQKGTAKKKGKRHKHHKGEESDESISTEEDIQEDSNVGAELAEDAEALGSEHITEEKEQLIQELRTKEEQLLKQRESQENLAGKITSLESKLLSGGKNIIDHTNEQQRALEQRRQEIAEQKRKEREMCQQLEEREETTVEIRETYTSLQQEVELKTRKLKRMLSKLQQTKSEINDLSEDYSTDRRELEMTQDTLMKDLKLKYLIIENFIPPEEKAKVTTRLRYDEEEDQWKMLPLSTVTSTSSPHQSLMSKRPVSASGARRPVSEYARMAANMGMQGASRYKGENIMQFDLDLATKTTREYEGPVVNARVQAALFNALTELEADIDIDASFAQLASNARVKGIRKEKPRPKNKDANYPQPRGLVPK